MYITEINVKPVIRRKNRYFIISQNQLQILDSLLNDGSQKKYIDSNNNLRYSEHSGVLDFNNTKLVKIIVSGITNREDDNDDDILLPHNTKDTLNYALMFHTHPPTPYPGSRALSGIIYEFPSANDLNHFAYHYNRGNIQVSLIIAPEGMYIIKMKKDIKPINLANNMLIEKMERKILKINKHAIEKYGLDYTNHRKQLFFNQVAQDKLYIKAYNKMAQKYFHKNIYIRYKPREYDNSINKWIVKKLYIKLNI